MKMIMIYAAGIINDHEFCHVRKSMIRYCYSSCFDFEIIISYNITQSTFQLIYLANIFSIFILSSQKIRVKRQKVFLQRNVILQVIHMNKSTIYSPTTIHLLFIQSIFLKYCTSQYNFSFCDTETVVVFF